MQTKYPIIKKNIDKIRTDGRSFLGIDGGNIESKIWFCGIEFGSDLAGMEEYYKSSVEYHKIDDFDLPVPYRKNAGKFEKSTYDRFLSAIYLNLFNKEQLQNGNDTGLIVKVLKEDLYNQNSKIFKLNLYPLAKKSTEWDKTIENELGIKKEVYYKEIFNKRKDFLKDLVKEYNPKIIICTSTKEYKDVFEDTFLIENESVKYRWNYLTSSVKKFKIYEYKTDITTLIIIPFLGRGNLNSYKDVISMANYLKVKYLSKLI